MATKKTIKSPAIKAKIKILVYADSPAAPSGFGTVSRGIFKHLAQTGNYSIDILGINDSGGWKDPKNHPYHIYPAQLAGQKDAFGRSRFINIVRGANSEIQPPWDIIFVLNDPFVLEQPLMEFGLGTLPALRDIQKTHYTQLPPNMWFKSVGYFPVDSALKPEWVSSAINMVDMPVLYTKYGASEVEKANWQLDEPLDLKLHLIPHGNNFQEFYPLEKQVISKFRQDFFQGTLRPDTFLVTVIGRNQIRKDIARSMKIFKEFQRRRPDSFLYIHAQDQDAWGSLTEIAHSLGLQQTKDWNFPENFSAHHAFPHEILNGIYNSADVNLSTSLGEGWGLPITEAMATKTLNLAPAHTSIPELFNLIVKDEEVVVPTVKQLKPTILKQLRGIPLQTGSTSSEWISFGAKDLERIRPLTNVDDAVEKLLWVYDHEKEVRRITDNAYAWIQKHAWIDLASSWDQLFQKTYQDLLKERAQDDKTRQDWQKKPAIKSRVRNPNLNQ